MKILVKNGVSTTILKKCSKNIICVTYWSQLSICTKLVSAVIAVIDCHEKGYRLVGYWHENRRAMLDDVSMHDDLEDLYEAVKRYAFEIRNNAGRVDHIKSFTFRKLAKKELKMIEKRDQAFLNTFHRYGKCNRPNKSKFITDNLRYLVKDELKLKSSESKSRYALMICFRFTMLIGNPNLPELTRLSHFLVELPENGEPDFEKIKLQATELIKRRNCYTNVKIKLD